MKCAWEQLLAVLPPRMRHTVDEQGKDTLQELRLRLGLPAELLTTRGSLWNYPPVREEDLLFCVNTASRYSPWAAATIANGYISIPGGHRMGLCGEVVVEGGRMRGVRKVTSLCIRVARDLPGIGERADRFQGSILVIGSPGAGKTTLLRDLIRRRSEQGSGSVAVIDERGELFPSGVFPTGRRTDILTGCTKAQGISVALRTMGPACIAVDEITDGADCEALMQAGWCGVTLLATAHASGREDLYRRELYRPLVKSRLFDTLLVLHQDKSWTAERMES